jgi:hypothetical protein
VLCRIDRSDDARLNSLSSTSVISLPKRRQYNTLQFTTGSSDKYWLPNTVDQVRKGPDGGKHFLPATLTGSAIMRKRSLSFATKGRSNKPPLLPDALRRAVDLASGCPSPQHNSENPTLSLTYAEFDAAVITSTISRQGVAAAFYCPVLADQGQRIGAAITLRIQHSRINPRTNECFANIICTPL